MTQYYYIGAKKPLPTGIFGEEVTYQGNILVYESELAFTSLYIEALEEEYQPLPMRLPYVYIISINGAGSLDQSNNQNQYEKKCEHIFYEYIKEALIDNYSLEIYSCWSGQGEEELTSKKQGEIIYNQNTTSKEFLLEDREYIKIIRKPAW